MTGDSRQWMDPKPRRCPRCLHHARRRRQPNLPPPPWRHRHVPRILYLAVLVISMGNQATGILCCATIRYPIAQWHAHCS